jgi:hypothetical protein
MQSWAKRGLQTALVTGGLLMLGTGIASADENVNPDTLASPLDLHVAVPIDLGGNAIGTPLGQVDVPSYKTELSTEPANAVLGAALGTLSQTDQLSVPGGFSSAQGDLKGNKVAGNLVVPIQVSCNAIGVIDDASVTDCASSQTYSHHQDVVTSGKHSGIAGNAVVLDWAAPIQIDGNAGGILGGSAYASGYANQSATATGNICTDGEGSGLSGNVLAGQFATPVQVTGNAASYLLGNAYSEFDAGTAATSGGWIKTNGDGGAETGNVVGVPIALPIKFNCNAAGLWGSEAGTGNCDTSADAVAGDKRPDAAGRPAYIETAGGDSFLGGNVVAPQGSVIANVAGVAASWIGNACTGGGSSSSIVDSGGLITTNGTNSSAAGNIVNPAVALPVEAFGIGGALIGSAHGSHDNTTDANAGSGSFTNGTCAFLGGNIVNTQDALTTELFGVGGALAGNATGSANETKTITAGGYDGTLGNDSSGSGNIVQLPVTVPAEVFGVCGAIAGRATGSAEETKGVISGGGGNTVDDNGVISSNLAAVPISVPAQLFGIGGSVIGQSYGQATTDTTSTAGGDVKATGKLGTIAGNLIQAPFSLPVQGHGVGGSVLGVGSGVSDNLTDSKAGGNALTDGHDGGITGNIVQTPFAGAATIFGDGVALGGLGHGTSTNDILSTAGGDSTTNGDRGGLAGNVIGVEGVPIAQLFGDAGSVLAGAGGEAASTTVATTGGDVTTSGVEGGFSGSILDFPVAAVVQGFGDAVLVGGQANAVASNQTAGIMGGEASTGGDSSRFSGLELRRPIGALVQPYSVPVNLFGKESAQATNDTEIQPETLIALPNHMSEMAVDELPSLPLVGDLPATVPTKTPRTDLSEADGLPPLPVQVPSLTTLPILSSLPVQLPTKLPTVSALPTKLPGMSLVPASRVVEPVTDIPDVPVLGQLDNGPLGMFSKALAMLTGKRFHTQ